VSDISLEPEAPREKWNRRYSETGLVPFPDRPAEWLVENRSTLTALTGRRALDVACGDGRNALYLAQLGFSVVAIDVSDVVITSLREAATERGLAIDGRQVDLEHEPLPDERFDVIVQINYLQRDLFGRLAASLLPRGILIVETVTRSHVEELGREFDPRFVLDHNELLRSFPDLHVVHYREGITERSDRPRAVASIVAERRS
jgi:tellurite methyltransferase